MPIIVSKNGKNAVKLDKISFGLEDKLQEYIHDNPESIPLYDIKEDIKLLILAREFGTESGPIDAVGIDQDGQIYLVETKLYKNPDKRTVVAQVLDYGASLWKTLNDFDDFLIKLNAHVQKKFGMSTTEKIQEYFGIDDEQLQSVLEQMKLNLDEGNFKFVVMMDSIGKRLKDLIVYMNQNSKFDIYGVELEYYQHDNFEIMIPKIYGAQVKKDVATRKVSSAIPLSDKEFIEAFDLNIQEAVQSIVSLRDKISSNEISIQGLSSRKTAKNIYFYYKLPGENKNVLTAEIGVFGTTAGTDLRFHTDSETKYQPVLEQIETILGIPTNSLNSKRKYGLVSKWSLEKFSPDKFIKLFIELEKQYYNEF